MKKILNNKMLCCKENKQTSTRSSTNDCFCACSVCNFPSKNEMETEKARPYCVSANKMFQIKRNRQGCTSLLPVIWSLLFFSFETFHLLFKPRQEKKHF